MPRSGLGPTELELAIGIGQDASAEQARCAHLGSRYRLRGAVDDPAAKAGTGLHFDVELMALRFVGHVRLHQAVLEYDRTINRVETELLLLNIARVRHNQPIHFTAVSSIAATFDFRVSGVVQW